MPKEISIRDIRSSHIGKEIVVKGMVLKESEIRPQVTSAIFKCLKCDEGLQVIQIDQEFRSPNNCKCGFKGPFRLVSKNFEDIKETIIIDHIDSDIKRIKVVFENELISEKNDRISSLGKNVEITGILEEDPIYLGEGNISTRFDWILKAKALKQLAS